MTPASDRRKIVLSGMVAGDPGQGGATWAVLQYLLGLRALGHDVVLVEPLRAAPGAPDPLDPRSATVRYFDGLGLDGRAALLAAGTRRTHGMAYAELAAFASGADLLIDVSGMLADERLLEPIPVRAFLDLDPGFVQAWHETGEDMGLDRHTHFVTVGQAIGTAGCAIPTCGREWIATVPPVALDRWPVTPRPAREAFTSVGHWRSYGSLEHGGIHYGQRAHSLRELIELPRRNDARFELALGIHPDERDDIDALERNGWVLADPATAAGSPDRYAAFVRASLAELGVAKSGYVATCSGWFSDRSACYLASGRPVVAQDTGFGAFLPTGEGLLTFADVDAAAAAVDEVRGDWDRHSRAARELAEEHLDARKVLTRLLAALDGKPRAAATAPDVASLGAGRAARDAQPPSAGAGRAGGRPTDAQLRAALAADGVAKPVEIARRPSRYRTSFPIEELDVTLADGSELRLVLKQLGWESLTDGARSAKPRFLHDPAREAAVYAALLAPADLGTPRLYASVADDADGGWLLIERIDGVELFQVGERELWEATARWLAAAHAHFAPDLDRHRVEGRLLEYDEDRYRRWLHRALQFARDDEAHERTEALDWLAPRYDAAVSELVALPRTVIHGELYASNVLVDARGAVARIAPVDWELAAAAPGLVDLAALVSGGWSSKDRDAIASAYLEAAGADSPQRRRELDLCRLALAVQWLGWAPSDWAPPEGHRHDWLGEALVLAEQLELR